jgi:hypothetical protein
MARLAVKDRGVKAPVKAALAKKSGSSVEDELSVLTVQNKELEDSERAKTGGQSSFITLVQGNSGILLPDDNAYIKGVKLHDYVISSKKLRLGATLDVTILGLFKLYAETYKTTNYYPKFEISGRNFKLDEDGKVIPVKGGLKADEIKEILLRSNKVQKDYADMKLVSKKNNIATLIGAPQSRAALPAGKGGYEEVEDDEETDF